MKKQLDAAESKIKRLTDENEQLHKKIEGLERQQNEFQKEFAKNSPSAAGATGFTKPISKTVSAAPQTGIVLIYEQGLKFTCIYMKCLL